MSSVNASAPQRDPLFVTGAGIVAGSTVVGGYSLSGRGKRERLGEQVAAGTQDLKLLRAAHMREIEHVMIERDHPASGTSVAEAKQWAQDRLSWRTTKAVTASGDEKLMSVVGFGPAGASTEEALESVRILGRSRDGAAAGVVRAGEHYFPVVFGSSLTPALKVDGLLGGSAMVARMDDYTSFWAASDCLETVVTSNGTPLRRLGTTADGGVTMWLAKVNSSRTELSAARDALRGMNATARYLQVGAAAGIAVGAAAMAYTMLRNDG